jgi:hypothetical protein
MSRLEQIESGAGVPTERITIPFTHWGRIRTALLNYNYTGASLSITLNREGRFLVEELIECLD